MKTRNFALTALSAALLAAFAQMAAAEEDLAEFISPNASIVSVGVGNWSGDRMQQGKFDGMRDKGTYGTLDGSYLNRDDNTGTWTSFYIKNFGLDTAEFGGRYEVQGNWGVKLDYTRIHRDHPVTINTGLQGIGTQRQTVTPVAIGAGSNVLLDLRRDGTTISGFKRFSPELEFKVTFKNEDKEGNRQYGVRNYPTLGSTAGSYPAFVAEPISSNTRQLDALLNYKGKKLSVVAGYYGSWYDNHFTRLDVIGTAAGVTEMSLPPDNQAHQIYARANYMFTPTTRGLFKLSRTHATQNDPFISTMNNNRAEWAPKAGTGSSLNGVVDTTEMSMGLSARPMPKLLMRADLSYYDRNDKTPIRLDSSNTAGTTVYHNNPFHLTNTKAKVEGDYRLTDTYSLNAGYDFFHQKRSISDQIVKTIELFVPYRSSIDEKTYRIALRRSMSKDLSGSVGYSHSDRTGANYDDVSTSVDSATITPIYLANRKRDKLKLTVDWTATSAFGMQGTYAASKDRYPVDGGRKDGVREGKSQIFTLDANLALNDDWKANAWYSTEFNRINLTGPLAGVTDWVENTLDRADTLGLGIKGKATPALTLGAKFDMTLSWGEFKQEPSSTSPLPNVANRETKLNLFAEYAIQKHSSVRIDLISEQYKTDDWRWRFSNGDAFSYATEGTQVVSNPDQSATFVGVRYNYKFH